MHLGYSGRRPKSQKARDWRDDPVARRDESEDRHPQESCPIAEPRPEPRGSNKSVQVRTRQNAGPTRFRPADAAMAEGVSYPPRRGTNRTQERIMTTVASKLVLAVAGAVASVASFA